MDPRLTRLRALFAADWQAMKAGTYTAPLPHPSIVNIVNIVGNDPSTRKAAPGKKGECNV